MHRRWRSLRAFAAAHGSTPADGKHRRPTSRHCREHYSYSNRKLLGLFVCGCHIRIPYLQFTISLVWNSKGSLSILPGRPSCYCSALCWLSAPELPTSSTAVVDWGPLGLPGFISLDEIQKNNSTVSFASKVILSAPKLHLLIFSMKMQCLYRIGQPTWPAVGGILNQRLLCLAGLKRLSSSELFVETSSIRASAGCCRLPASGNAMRTRSALHCAARAGA